MAHLYENVYFFSKRRSVESQKMAKHLTDNSIIHTVYENGDTPITDVRPCITYVKNEYHGTIVNGNKVSIIMYNSDVDKDKVKEYGVKGFPTLFVEKDGIKESFPHRTYDKIVEYIKSN